MSSVQDPRKAWLATGSQLTVWWRMPSLGLFAPFWLWMLPACVPASCGGWAGSLPASSPLVFAQSFVLWARQCLRLGVFVGKFSLSLSFFPLSLSIPQFGLLSHISSLRLPSGHLVLVLAPSSMAHASLFSPQVADVSIWATFLLGIPVRDVICGFYLFIFIYYFSSQLCCPLRFQNSPQIHWWEAFWHLETSPLSRLPSWNGSLSLTLLSSFFIFNILSYLLLKTMSCLSGYLMSSANIQKLFYGIFSVFKCSFNEFVGEKVVSLTYSSAILGPPPMYVF